MIPRFVAALLLTAGVRGCVAYEYEHEFWLRVDGSGTVNVTGRPVLWAVFKGLASSRGPNDAEVQAAARALFEGSGLRVKSVTLTHRRGQPYLLVSADFDDVNRLSGTPAFPDLTIGLRREAERLVLEGSWGRPHSPSEPSGSERDGLMAVRFHVPAKVYAHKNAFAGVERGNIVGWRQDVAQALTGGRLDFGVTMDRRSILLSTVSLFGGTIALAAAILGGAFYLVIRKGRGRRPLAGKG